VPQREVVWRFDVVEREEEIWPWEFWKRWRWKLSSAFNINKEHDIRQTLVCLINWTDNIWSKSPDFGTPKSPKPDPTFTHNIIQTHKIQIKLKKNMYAKLSIIKSYINSSKKMKKKYRHCQNQGKI
jgi:hypothetical protein